MIENIQLFSDFTTEEQKKISSLIIVQQYHDSRTVYASGEPSENLFIIQKGAVSITHELDRDMVTIANLEQGYFFGESGILNNKQIHQSEARASKDDTVILKLSKDNFEKLKIDSPEIALKILEKIASVLSERLTEDTTRIAIISAISDLINMPEHLNNIDSLASEILAITVRAIPSAGAFLGIYKKENSDQLDIIASIGLSPKHIPKTFAASSDAYMHKLRTEDGSIRISSSAYAMSEKSFYAKRNLLAKSIKVEEKNIGVLALADKARGEFSSNNVLMLSIISGQISFALEEARLREEKIGQEELKREYVGI
ncbi:MAG: hypothetical protein COV79_00500 [Parcubacteria group bacterium CG11_big_fil_rev_8_21_14_0_20_41_14]|nr:MAG: hypothetical protein COV79_00500 [Parcubacteria group bacterium CG11_big_fil_rev_8_21_14_0_20_41_14]PIR57136.1 MAG: hypothetical protein COU72_02550 [Parcubacteria group bacterium CG10_big_fil_rev_8_21_14_0_10_41_35]